MTRNVASRGLRVPQAPDFVGRAKELAALRQVLTQPSALVLVEGEAGIGKSRLLRELLAGRRAVRSLLSSCPPFRQPQTLGPVVDAVRQVSDDVAGLGLSPLAGALRSLLPEWAGVLPPALEPAEDATAARHRLFRALAELLDRLGVGLVVVEDAHWADEATLEFLLFLVAAQARPVSLVVSYRPEDVPDSSLLRQLSSRRPADGVLLRVGLDALDLTETAQMVSSMLSGEPVPADFARFVHARTDGVPLAVEESLRLMADRADLALRAGGLVRRRLSRIDVPPTIRDAVLQRAGRLDELARTVLRAVAVLAEPAPAAVVAAVAGLDGGQAQAGLAEAVDCGLVAHDDGGLVAFRHVLASQAVYEAISPGERQQMHQRAGEALQAPPPGAPPTAAMRLVRHFRESGDMTVCARHAERAADFAVAAGDEMAVERLIYDLVSCGGIRGLVLARLASRISFTLPVDEARYADLIAAFRSALADEGLQSADRAAIHLQVGRMLLVGDYDEAGLAELEMAVRELPTGSAESARAMIRLGMPFGEYPVSVHRRWLQQAAAVTASMDGPGWLSAAVDHMTALLMLGEQSGWAAAARIPDDAPTVPEMRQIARAALNVADMAVTWGHYAEVDGQLATALRLAEQHGHYRVPGIARVVRARLDWFTGAWEQLAEEAASLTVSDDITPMPRSQAAFVRGLLQDATGQHEHAEACFRAALSQNRQFNIMLTIEPAAALARLRLDAGDVSGALEATEEPVRIVTVKGIWVWATELAPARADALVKAGRVAEAAELVAAMARGLSHRDAPAARAGLALCRAIVTQGRGEHLKAAAAFSRTADAWQALPRPYDALLAREREAACLLAAGQREDAVTLLTDVARDLARLGATAAADRAFLTLRAHGVTARRPVPGRPGYGDELSPRELEVVRLLAEGHSVRAIAETLVVTMKTVRYHLASARRKLSAPSRATLVVAAMDAGLIPGHASR